MPCGCVLGRWQAPKRKYRHLLPRWCLLEPEGLNYPFCKKAKGKYIPNCKGLLAARRRAIMSGNCRIEQAAIAKAKEVGCPWSEESTAKCARRRKRQRSRR